MIFFDLYPGLRAYHNKQKSFAREHGFVISPLGRIRHQPLVKSPDNFVRGRQERMPINAPIQSTLSDLCCGGCRRERQSQHDLGPDSGGEDRVTVDRRRYGEPSRRDKEASASLHQIKL
jgi:DNA polymerase family A